MGESDMFVQSIVGVAVGCEVGATSDGLVAFVAVELGNETTNIICAKLYTWGV